MSGKNRESGVLSASVSAEGSTPLLQRRLLGYSAAAAATVAVWNSGSAQAETIVWDIEDQLLAGVGIQFNLTTGVFSAATATTGAEPGPDGAFRIAFGNFFDFYLELAGPFNKPVGFANAIFNGPIADSVYADLIGPNSPVGADLQFGARSDFPNYGSYGFFVPAFDTSRGFAGIRFQIGEETHYGWAEVSGAATPTGPTLHSFGYNDVPDEAAITSDPSGPGTPVLPVITSISVDGDDLTLDFTGQDGVTYDLRQSTDLIAPFTSTEVTGATTDGVGRLTFIGGASGPRGFLRLSAE